MPGIIAGLILSFLVMLLFGGTELDRSLLLLAGQIDAPRLKEAAAMVASAATPLPLLGATAAGIAYLLVRRDWPRALLLGGMVAGGFVLVAVLQGTTAGLRPSAGERLTPTQDAGFPSGHAAWATSALVGIAFLVSRHRPARPLALGFAAWAALTVGVARILTGGNWPSDVIGGWSFGLAWTLLLLRLAGEDLGDGTASPLRHSSGQGETDGKPQNRDRPPD
jgi:undecaprenyl-diphosphatase